MTEKATAAPVAFKDEEAAALEWIEVIPSGTVVKGRDGRTWRNTDPGSIVRAFNRDQTAVVVDWEHGSELRGSTGRRAPAAGWIEELVAQDDGAIQGRRVMDTAGSGRRDRAWLSLSLSDLPV